MPTKASIGECSHQQRLAEVRDRRGLVVLAQVIDELALDGERPAPERHDGLAARLDLRQLRGQQMHHVARVERRADHRHRAGFRDRRGGGQDRRAAEAVADQQSRRHAAPP